MLSEPHFTTAPPASRQASEATDTGFEGALMAVLSQAYGYALRLTRHKADAEDLLQEAALCACRARDSFEQGTNFKAWYFKILTRCFWARHRKSRRRPEESVDLDDVHELYLYSQSAQAGLPVTGDDPAAALFTRLDEEKVSQALEALPQEFRVACTLYFIEDFSYQEIASVLDVPVGTVRSRLHRGRRMLQKALWVVAMDAGIIAGLASTEAQ